ncbi:chromosomal replication initiator DnaA [Rhodobacter sp. SGA-6-6]|uniref:DnaA ATPase domain-containing protein n=1 Tax=Rhodobacter sp. SGA-6-6 TaxID=2710882 RepID=UPI0013EBB8BB|nr:DnaA/Hda family protein [Rhodobacter sp. SGA-6-6]NGM45373.1 chromosomal replication initiator DnaA [Rhodobacter sp. SGA-6-6]
MSRQLVFDLPAKDGMTRAEFFVSPANALALAALDGWKGWPGGKMLLLGPTGAGKTHLAQIWATETGATVVAAADLAALDLPALAAAGRVAVEDAAAVAGDAQAEAALFHLHNLLAEARGALLLTAAAPPRDWGLTLPDLLSRMQAAPVTRLEAPDDALLSAVLVKLFADRQLAVAPNLIPYLLARMPRSIGAARALVAALDAAALAEGRPVTRALAAGLLPPEE